MFDRRRPRPRIPLARILLALAVVAAAKWIRGPAAVVVAGAALVLIALTEPDPTPAR
jgi:hypothetical protein